MQKGQFADMPWIWERLRAEMRPIALYGMGDGADKALAQCARMGIEVAAVFASDDFVRGQSFRGYTVQTLAQTEAALGDFVVLLCFASERPEVLAQIMAVAERHDLLVPDFPVCGEELFTPGFYRAHQDAFESAEALLADAQSRAVFRDVIAGKLTGDLRCLRRCETPRAEVYEALLPLCEEEFFVDGGAYTGDTVEAFVQRTQARFLGILAVEPDRRNFAKLTRTVERFGVADRTRCVNAGLWSGAGVLAFDHRSGRQAAFRAGGGAVETPVDSVDNLLAGERATLLAFDVEGAEREALLGSAQTIRAHKPKLAIAAYHRREDLFDLVQLIHSLCPDYRIFLRRHPCLPAWEANLYCTI